MATKYLKTGKDKKMSNDIDMLKTILRAVQEERYATAEILLQVAIREKTVLDSSYPDGDGYWQDTKENVA
jgi:hypothetical protein